MTHSHRLADLVDLEAIQRVTDSHFQATGIPIGIIDAFDGSVLVGAGWQDICVKFHRAHPETEKRCHESDRYIRDHLNREGPCKYKCRNGLWDIGMPIIAGGRHLASMFLGQFFYEGEVPDRQFFKDQAQEFGFDQEAYLAALDEVPVFSRQKIDMILEYDYAMTGFLADLAENALERERAEQERGVLEMRLRQAEKMDALGHLAGGIAHDFNNLLGGIIGSAEMMELFLPDDPALRKYHKIILETATRAADLTGKLLAFSRSTPPASSPIDVHEIVKEIQTLLNSTIDRRIELEVRLEADRSSVVGDPSQLQNALLNMGINASHAMPGGGRFTISSRNTYLDEVFCKASVFNLAPGHYIELEVRDTGSGIEPENLDRIFDPFFTTKAQEKGTGLGLAMVFSTVKQHGGSITAHSEVGRGTSFKILLPLAGEGGLVKLEAPPAVKGSGLILVVDDERVVRITAQGILESLGYQILTAQNGQEALDIYTRMDGKIDLVLLDMVMPVMNGKDCFRALKKIDPQVRVVLSSGFTQEQDLAEMKDLGLKAFIRKPFRSASVSMVVHEALTG